MYCASVVAVISSDDIKCFNGRSKTRSFCKKHRIHFGCCCLEVQRYWYFKQNKLVWCLSRNIDSVFCARFHVNFDFCASYEAFLEHQSDWASELQLVCLIFPPHANSLLSRKEVSRGHVFRAQRLGGAKVPTLVWQLHNFFPLLKAPKKTLSSSAQNTRGTTAQAPKIIDPKVRAGTKLPENFRTF